MNGGGKVGLVTGGKILVVDDDAMLRSSVAALLTDEGYEVDLATDGVDALAKIQASPPDVILLDVLMPRMDGKALLETLHADAVTTGTSVLVMTALQGFEAKRTIALGAADLVEKPFDMDNLLNKVALAMYRARQARDGQDSSAQLRRGVILVAGDTRADVDRVERMAQDRGYTVVALVHITDELPRLARLFEPQAVVLTHRSRATAAAAEKALRDQNHKLPILVVAPDGDAQALLDQNLA